MPAISGRLKTIDTFWQKNKKNCHPGLALEKLIDVPEKQEDAKTGINEVISATKDQALLDALNRKRAGFLKGLASKCWKIPLVSPMALHLSKAAILDNANVCLHRTYGFAYLPGTGLKGLARAYAETVWLPAQEDKTKAWKIIENVFGWAPEERREQRLKEYPGIQKTRKNKETGKEEPIDSQAGQVLFHDAWPLSWPKLELDLTTPHHPKYYMSDKEADAPGDWESPRPISFLTVARDSSFHFSLSLNGRSKNNELLDFASQFLTGALSGLGAGAKTNAGYGTFAPLSETEALPVCRQASKSYSIKLVTPAFLAGAEQQRNDCELRVSTLRGLLRWWWRTLHAKHLSVNQLRTLEKFVWGSASHGGPVKLRIKDAGDVHNQAQSFKREEILEQGNGKQAEITYRNRHFTGAPPRITEPKKVSPGLTYLSYGMAEKATRYILPQGSRWIVEVVVRDGKIIEERGKKTIDRGTIPADLIMEQVSMALWLLSQYGGVGAKNGKGFGSIEVLVNNQAIEGSIKAARECSSKLRRLTEESWPELYSIKGKSPTPSIEEILTFKADIQTNWSNPLGALHLVGYSVACFAATHAHNPEKAALGLPRRTQGGAVSKPRFIQDRFSSPWKLSFHHGEGGLKLRYCAFPNPHVPLDPTSGKSTDWLTKLRDHLQTDILKRVSEEMEEPNFPYHENDPGNSAGVQRTFTHAEHEMLLLHLPPNSFVPGQKNAIEDKITELLAKLKALENDKAIHSQVISEYHRGLSLSDKGTRKKLNKKEKYTSLIEYLMKHNQPE